MEKGCRQVFLVLLGIGLFLGAITMMKSCGLLEMIDNPGGVVPDNVPIPGQ